MNWNVLSAAADVVEAAGVIASLVYVAAQVRQNTRSVRAATYDSLVKSSGDWLSALIQDPALAANFELAVSNWAEVDEVERPRIMYLLTQLFRQWENVFFQQRQGTLEPGLWHTWERVILSYFHKPGIQEWWTWRHSAYSPEFCKFLEESSAPPPAIRTTREIDRANR